jgi:tRNA A-37 threonylcarbamoyl transferase component Bud32
MIPFCCPACQKRFSVKDEMAGKKGRCPGCGQFVAVPPPADDATQGGGASEGPGADFLAPPRSAGELGRLGKYRILQVLGRGGMGVVYLAEDPALKRRVALKAMLPSLAAGPSAGKRFLREAQAMAAVEHDHIVRIYQVDEDRGVPFLAMELLRGETLEARLRRPGPLPVAEVLRVGREIASALAAAHATGLIHRDVKPANVWLEDRTPPGRAEHVPARVKILDFGLARVSDDPSLTQPGAIMGTPAYMAPEQARGEAVDARTDLFSLGVVLYRLCTGRPPFRGPDALSVLVEVATHQPVSPNRLSADLPQGLSDLVMRLLEKDPGRRPASAALVVEELLALERTLGQGDTVPAPAAAARPPGGTRRRPRFLALAAVLLLGGLLAGGAVALRAWSGREPERPVTERPVTEPPAGEPPQPAERWVSLFNGADLTGWEYRRSVWKVKDGTITATTFPGHRKYNTFLCYKEPFKNFELAFDVQLQGNNNSGVMFRSKLYDRKNYWLDGFKCDMGGRTGWGTLVTYDGKTGNTLRRGRKGEIPPGIAPGGFDRVVLRCVGNQVSMRVNDRQVQKSEVAKLPAEGRIAFQLRHSLPTAVTLKNIRVRLLTPGGDPDADPLGEPAWRKRVAALPAEKQVGEVTAKLKQRNPGFAGPVMPRIENGVVTGLAFSADKVRDLSPLRALPGLTELDCPGADGNAPLADLSPLVGLRLTKVNCKRTRVSSLWPLKDMKLTKLLCTGTRVSDLWPLRGMPLTNLQFSATPVEDLSPLKGMRLKVLTLNETKVRDLSPLEGMPLEALHCRHTPVSDLRPLKDMKLKDLWCDQTQATDLSVLRGMPLKEIWCDVKTGRDVEVLGSLRKTLVTINQKPAKEFWKSVGGK